MRRWSIVTMAAVVAAALMPTGVGAEQPDDGSWVHTRELARPGPALRSENFGYWVAIDGDTLVVGNPGRRRSTVHVFSRDPDSGGWSHTQEIATRPTSVAVSGDTLVAGGTVFTRDPATGVWSATQELSVGRAVIEGDTLVTGGSGRIRFFARDPVTGVWSPTQEFDRPEPVNRQSWGSTKALSGDTLAVSGADSARRRGAVFVYSRDPDTGVWSYTQKLWDPDPEEREFFGYSLAMEGDTLVVGARWDDDGRGALHVFTRDPADGMWSHTQKITGRSGAVMSGDTLVSGRTVLTRDPATGTWSFDQRLTYPGNSEGRYGGVAMSGDTLVTGNYRAHSRRGVVHVFTRGGSTGRVSGTVSHSDGSPVGGSARVVLGELSVDGDVVDLRWVCTSEDGGYVFTGVRFGVDLVAAVTGTGWASHCRRGAADRYLSQYFDRHDGVEIYDPFRITAGSPHSRIDFDLRRPVPGERACMGELATIEGTAGDDHLVGTSGRDVIVAGAGDDRIDGGGGDDLICAGTGADTVDGGSGDDTLAGNGDNDSLSGGPGDDIIDGGPGDDTLAGNGGNDWLDGGPGDDSLGGGPGTDTLIDRQGTNICHAPTGETAFCRR